MHFCLARLHDWVQLNFPIIAVKELLPRGWWHPQWAVLFHTRERLFSTAMYKGQPDLDDPSCLSSQVILY